MNYDEIAYLQARHASWALLRSTHAPLILSFLGRVFVDGDVGVSGLPAGELVDQLDDELYALNDRLGEGTYPRSPAAYLDEWAAPERGWLRKFYAAGSDEPRYEVTPPVEKALLWIRDLPAREFVGTESRLNTLFELLRQMVFGADADPERRLTELRRRRSELDAEIARAELGEVTLLDDVGQRDRYQQFARNARELLADFREVEENFRGLDRKLREQIASWTGSKGELLDEVVGTRAGIAESDQGRSFQALYDFLLSHQRQAELTELLDRLADIEVTESDQRLHHIHHDWIDAGERTQGTVRLLSEQLRRFLDDQVWLENRRVFDLLKGIESAALQLRSVPVGLSMKLDDTAVSVTLPFERPLYVPQRGVMVDSGSVEEGSGDFDSSVLLDQIHVDRDALARSVRKRLQRQDQVALSGLVGDQPLQHGLAELVGYLSLVDSGFDVVFDEDRRDEVSWSDEDTTRVADLPYVTFSRRSERA
jgi:flagellar motility protein MotE (MotC chaperone)